MLAGAALAAGLVRRHLSAATAFVIIVLGASVVLTCAHALGVQSEQPVAAVSGSSPTTPAGDQAGHAASVAGAELVRTLTPPMAVLATNRHCDDDVAIPSGGQPPCGVRSMWLSAVGARRVLIEGWGYERRSVASAGRTFTRLDRQLFWDPRRLEINDNFFRSPNAQTAAAVCALGAQWAVIDARIPGTAADFSAAGVPVGTARGVTVLRLNCPGVGLAP